MPKDWIGSVIKFNELDGEPVKTLGVHWEPVGDSITYHTQIVSIMEKCTKRVVVSEMSKLYDPLGFCAPFVVRAKMIVQNLWRLQVQWDETVPLVIQTQWNEFRTSLNKLNDLKIIRQVTPKKSSNDLELHIFCDASEKAFGACAYIRGITVDGKINTQLLMAKSRVAPVKQQTIPRLELCAAVLASRLFKHIEVAWKRLVKFKSVTLWTDSAIVLAWLNLATSKQWKTFVANRVAEIHEITVNGKWKHVSGIDNPADDISRGLSAEELLTRERWWHGPAWMAHTEELWPTTESLSQVEVPEQKLIKQTYMIIEKSELKLHDHYSKLERLQRAAVYLRLFTNWISNRNQSLNTLKVGAPCADELSNALRSLIKGSQITYFPLEIDNLKHQIPIKKKSSLQTLSPFLDKEDMLRVGGRIDKSNLLYENQHQLILPPNGHLTRLIVEFEHRKLMHAGIQHTISSLRQQYNIVSLTRLVKSTLHRCIPCYRWRASGARQIMGQLPAARVVPAPPFSVCGVDYAGPMKVRYGNNRANPGKAYIALFVCFTTKAIHIELVSKLSTANFIMALNRFISRRGRPTDIHSDNGTNFVGAARALTDFFNDHSNRSTITSSVANQGIRWHFIPPQAPHFGGLWEAGIKSVKGHLNRVIGDTTLTVEEYWTVLTEIEGILNSRPLVPQNNHSNDLTALTPAHFLIGRPISAIPQPDLTNEKCLPHRWQLTQQISQHFWKH